MERDAGSRDLNPTSYVVLGMLMLFRPMTAYELKQTLGRTVGNFWTFSHSQLYGEPARLAQGGYVKAANEAGGRRRRTFSITEKGHEAVKKWLAEPTQGWTTEVRDPGLLKLFFSSLSSPEQVQALAADQEEAHSQRLEIYQKMRQARSAERDGYRLATLELGLRMERTVAEFWRWVRENPPKPPEPPGEEAGND